jgi:intracellular multiplication protein IcmK
MKRVLIGAAVAFLCATSFAQHTPPVGAAPVSDASVDAKAARRSIMRDSMDRQYTGPEMDEYRGAVDSYERAKSGLYQEAAKVVRRRVSVGLAPDSDVPEIRLNAENVGAVVFTDSLGSPWRVADVVAPGYVSASKHENMVIFRPAVGNSQQAPVKFGRGSATVLLEGLTSTVTFAVSYGLSREVDGQMEAQIQARNPAAAVSAVQGGSIETDDVFGLFLDGEPPKGANKVRTTHKSVEAWMFQGRLYVRTTMSLHSPAFRMYGGSAAGVNVYRFDRIPSIINAINDGAIVAVGIGD